MSHGWYKSRDSYALSTSHNRRLSAAHSVRLIRFASLLRTINTSQPTTIDGSLTLEYSTTIADDCRDWSLPVTVRTGTDPALEPEAIRNESGKIRLVRPFTDNSQDVAIRCIQQQRSDSYESESDNDLAHRPDRWSRDQNPDLWLVQSQIWASPNSNPKVNQQLNAIFQLINY